MKARTVGGKWMELAQDHVQGIVLVLEVFNIRGVPSQRAQ
jgi:hypothetical protein